MAEPLAGTSSSVWLGLIPRLAANTGAANNNGIITNKPINFFNSSPFLVERGMIAHPPHFTGYTPVAVKISVPVSVPEGV